MLGEQPHSCHTAFHPVLDKLLYENMAILASSSKQVIWSYLYLSTFTPLIHVPVHALVTVSVM